MGEARNLLLPRELNLRRSRRECHERAVDVTRYPWSPETLIRASGLTGWEFSNVVTSDPAMRPYVRAIVSAPSVDLGNGFEQFANERGHAGSDLFKSVAHKTRKMDRYRSECDLNRTPLIVTLSSACSNGKQRSANAPAPSTSSAWCWGAACRWPRRAPHSH